MRPRHYCRGRGAMRRKLIVELAGFNEAPALLPGKRLTDTWFILPSYTLQ